MRDAKHLPLTAEHRDLYEIIHRYYWQELHDFPNLIRCRGLNDRVQWLKLFDQSEETVRCSDKILVRDYIRERVGEQHLVKLYQVCDHFSEIDFEALPREFVIKANHDSGTVILVRDKQNFDKASAANRIEHAIQHSYGWEKGEWAYSFIRPRILVEEFIEPGDPLPPPDYKFHCVEGKVKWLQYIYDRGRDAKEVIVDTNGCATSIHLYQPMKHVETFDMPGGWDDLCQVAEKLSAGWKYVRIDLFLSKGKIYAGEITFFTYCGCYQGEGQKKLGQLLDFDRTTFKPPVYKKLKPSFR